MKRFLGTLLCLCMLLTLLPVNALAAETVSSGSCGSNLTWELDSDGTLTISGTGEMNYYNTPWESNRSEIKKVILKNGVTSIGDYAFRDCSNMTSVTIPKGVKSIGSRAFYNCSRLTSVTIPDSVTSIGSYAFGACNNIKEVHITDIAAWCKISFWHETNSSNPSIFRCI